MSNDLIVEETSEEKDIDSKEWESIMKAANDLSKTYEENRIKGKYRWDREKAEEIKGYSLEELICDPYFLGFQNIIRPAVLDDIYELWEERRKRRIHVVCFEEGIGSGKTEKSSIILWLQWLELCCYVNPQKHFNLAPTSRIAFVCSSRTEAQARRIGFSKVWGKFACPFNSDYFPPDPRHKAEILIDRNNTCVYAGNSSALSVQGFDYFGGLMDECNSMERVEDSKKSYSEDGAYDAAEELESAITSRMTSRFFERAGMLVCTSSTVFEDDFLRRKRREWEELGDDSFVFYKSRHLVDVFAVSDNPISKKYNKNVEFRFPPEEGYFYVDADSMTEVSENVATAYFKFIDALNLIKKTLMNKWGIKEKDYKETEKLRKLWRAKKKKGKDE